jgi:23S rRNA (pseudouridine1915-N3)-methyltransferase
VKIHLIAVGTRMPDWVQSAYADYAARLPRECRLELREIAAGERGKNADIERLKREEGERVLKALPRGAQAIALDERGEAQSGNDMALLIGGPDGHAPEVLARSTTRWSLSRLTLPHPLVRVVVAEQLYRASSILANHPYHRG